MYDTDDKYYQRKDKLMNKIYFGDNLEILREFESGSIDLIYPDKGEMNGY
jgi:DNA modification methylase